MTYTLHQRQCGRRLDSGWFEARSVPGGFSLRFPLPVNDFTVAYPPGSKGASMSMHALGRKDGRGVEFACADFYQLDPGEGAMGEGVFKALSMKFPVKRTTIQRGTVRALHLSYPGGEYEFITQAGHEYSLGVVYPKALAGEVLPRCEPFFASFRLPKRP
jgi:hypothetical protein